MIDPKELRKNNLIQCQFGIGPVLAINENDSVAIGPCDIGKYTGFKDDFNPIPLTPERLERLGVRFDESLDEWQIESDLVISKNDSKPCPKGKEWLMWIKNTNRTEYFLVTSMGYVHECQNKVHALTGQELTIKEKANG